MHIHLPKPLHGWKEFANEIFVIVIGVLIALGFEQVVEEVHWMHKVDEGEEMLKDEAERNFGMQLEAFVVAPCIDAQLEKVQRNLAEPANERQPLERFSDKTERYVMRVPSRAVFTATWESLIADGTLNHMDQKRFGLWGSYYQAIQKQNAVASDLLERTNGLMILANPVTISPDARIALLDKVEQFSVVAYRSRAVALRSIDWYRKLDLKVPAERIDTLIATSPTVTFCRAQGLPLADWQDALKEKLPPMAM